MSEARDSKESRPQRYGTLADVPKRVEQDADGAWRWVYEIRLWRDSLIVVTVIKVILLASLAPFCLLAFLALIEGNLGDVYPQLVRVYLMVAGILMGLFFVAYYLVYVPFLGGRYLVAYELDDVGILHLEAPNQVPRSLLLSWLGVAAGIAARNPAAAGANLLAASRKQMYSRFKGVRKVVVYGKKRVLKLISRDMTRNLIYTPREDFERVLTRILQACPPTVKVVRK